MKDTFDGGSRPKERSRDAFWLARRGAVGVVVAYVAVILVIMLPAVQT